MDSKSLIICFQTPSASPTTIEKIPQKMVFIVDDNIIGHGKAASKRALDLFKGIIDRGIKKEWFCQASLNFADDEEIPNLSDFSMMAVG